MLGKFLRLLLVPFALIAVGIVRLISPWVLIRFGESWAHRIGHLAGNNECYLCERDAGMHGRKSGRPMVDIFCHRYGHANKYLEKMFTRCMNIDRTRFTALVSLVNKMFRGWERHVAEPTQLDRDVHNLFEKFPPHLYFNKAEEIRGRRLRRELGIPDGAPWVCLIVRDGAYLPELGYHGHRDSDIMNYVPMALELAKRGYYVVRMGAKVAQAMNVRHSHIIDYATNGQRSEFMDIYLGAKCAFCVSTGTGFDAIPMIFRRPICYVNYVPLEYLMTFVPGLAIWKHHVRNGRRMTPMEIYDSGAGQFMRADEFVAAGITLEENSFGEIMDVVMEMADGIAGKPITALQNEFWSQFPISHSPYNGQPLHGKFRLRIGSKFLESYAPVTTNAPTIDCAA